MLDTIADPNWSVISHQVQTNMEHLPEIVRRRFLSVNVGLSFYGVPPPEVMNLTSSSANLLWNYNSTVRVFIWATPEGIGARVKNVLTGKFLYQVGDNIDDIVDFVIRHASHPDMINNLKAM